MADVEDTEEDVEFEDILYLAGRAHEEKTGQEIPESVYRSISRPELGEGWDFDDDGEMKERYPKLFARFCSQ